SRGAYNQDDVSVFKQPTMEGHAVRSLLLGAGIAAAAEVNHRDDYRETVARWWANMAQAKMYVTGGMGSVPSIEGFGPDYELPNEGYNETCASVGAGFFSGRMNLLTGDAKYIDVLERELYNGALSGVSLQGDTYFYTNLLAAGPDHRRWGWKSGAVNITPCCPPMFLKLQGALPGYLYATDGAGIYVNLYAGSTARIGLKSGEVGLKQTTRYPWEGTVELAVTPKSPAAFPVNLRVPGWAKGAEVAVNGEPVKAETFNHYLRLERTWKAGDVVTLRLPMPVERVKADERVKANAGRVALMRGPVVYCLEGVDNEGRLASLQIPPGGEIHAGFQAGLLGGVTTLKGAAVRLREQAGEVRNEPAEFTAIPFFANSNRAPTDMAVWIADDASQVRPVTVAGEGEPTASHCNGNDTVRALNDGLAPKSSDDESIPRMTWWDHRGTPEWAQLTFSTPQTIQGVEVYWWDERRVGRDCRVPEKWTVQYRDGEEWKTVEDASGFGTELDTSNAVSFRPVTTTALRIAVQLQPNWSGGILEWRLRDGASLR
ncbi:MAG: hypothetical protein JWO82_2851, partial [Akkermansiaceae bacterium]|nr:hypothetical protein [Akkermansiaceae bacterium]